VSLLSRRDFLKLSGAGALGLLFAGLFPERIQAGEEPISQGRVTDGNIRVYDAPSTSANLVTSYWKDYVFPISEAVISDNHEDYNRVWYRLESGGFTYSGSIQPVMTILNTPVTTIPSQGVLAEVTVPYTDARRRPGRDEPVRYRLYYQTTHWVVGIEYDNSGTPWYLIQDDKWQDVRYYAQASHMHIYTPEELAPLSPDVPNYLKRIEIRLDDQLVIAYEGRHPVFMTRTATGARFRNGTYSTPLGHFQTFHKRPFRHMAAGDLASNGYDLPGVPWVCYITESGVALHGTYWHNDFGRPRSHGCINLPSRAAKWLYRWTQPVVPPEEQFALKSFGTGVDIFE